MVVCHYCLLLAMNLALVEMYLDLVEMYLDLDFDGNWTVMEIAL